MLKARARKEIYFHIFQFVVAIKLGGGDLHAFEHFVEDRTPPIGSLVIPRSHWNKDFAISWLNGFQKGKSVFDNRYLIESVETGEESWWGNIEILRFEPNSLSDDVMLKWRWSDEQFEENDLWKKAVKELGDLDVVALDLKFTDSDVFFKVRHRFSDVVSTTSERRNDTEHYPLAEIAKKLVSPNNEN